MSSSYKGRHRLRTRWFSGAAAALAVAGGAAVAAIPGTASAEGPSAVYTETSDWGSGFVGQYELSNPADAPLGDWTLSFDLPGDAQLTSLWNAEYQVSGQHVTVTPPSWQRALGPGQSLTVGFVARASGMTGEPTACRINDTGCSAESEPAPSTTTTTTTTSTAEQEPTPQPEPDTDDAARFAPYVDTSLYPPYDLLATAESTGVRNFNLAFVLSGGGCTPKWGGVSELGADGVPGQIDELRERGGDVRVSFGGAAGTELAQACPDATSLADAYGKVISTYDLTKVDFDVEGSALPDDAANTRRAKAIAQLQREAEAEGRRLDVSFTLPVLPSGLTQDGVDLLANAEAGGVAVGTVNVMAMDYGDGAAPNPDGRMGQYAIDAATATQAQVKSVLGLSDADAWQHVAVTPMIGLNDVVTETFTVADARQLTEFAESKGLGWLSMWSATRDKPCPGGSSGHAQPTCSSIDQQPLDFTNAFAAY